MKEKIRAVAGMKSCNRPLFLKSGGINYEDQYQKYKIEKVHIVLNMQNQYQRIHRKL